MLSLMTAYLVVVAYSGETTVKEMPSKLICDRVAQSVLATSAEQGRKAKVDCVNVDDLMRRLKE